MLLITIKKEKKVKAFLNSVFLLLCIGSAVVAVVAYGENPLTVPVVRISASSGQCLSVAVVSEGKEVEKSCDFFDRLKREGGRYDKEYVK
ncbi:MAG: hypothetical protein HZC04_00010 [Candidatus Lloydbacteria bacterium]|nr:hypothetical protein [Candidatus Lloydbacteria bacterium]